MGTLAGASAPFGSAPRLVGREREQRLLREALASTLGGRGGLVLLTGEAGIGKTALARDLAQEARVHGATVLLGRAYDLSEPPPYGIWLDLLGSAQTNSQLGELHAVLQPTAGQADGSQAAIFERVVAGFVWLAGQRPLVCVLDDLHWADPASFDLLRFVARQLAKHPFLLIGTYRADEVAEEHPLFKLLPALVREAEPLRIAMLPLKEEAIHQLVRADYALVAGDESRLLGYLHERTAGNPLYLGELLRTLEEERLLRLDNEGGWVLADLTSLRVPPLLRQVIAERLERLGAGAYHRLAVAAVIGQEVPLALWSEVAETPEEDLLALVEQASGARVLESRPDGLRVQFHHPLIRQTLYDGLLPSRRRTFHQQIADLLAVSPQPDLDAVADHLQRAGDPRAVAWLVRAGLRAHRAVALLSAAERLVAAARLLAGDGDRERERGWLLLYSARLIYFSDIPRALQYLAEANLLAARTGDRVLAAYLRLMSGATNGLFGEVRLDLPTIEQGIVALEALPDEYRSMSLQEVALAMINSLLLGVRETISAPTPSGTLPMALQRGMLVHWLALAGRYREALALGESVVASMVATLGDEAPGKFSAVCLGLGQARAALGQPVEARRQYARAVDAYRAQGDAFMVEFTRWAELHMVILPYEAENLVDRNRLVTEARRDWDRAGGTLTAAVHASFTELLVSLVEGRWNEAREQALAASTAPPTFRTQSANLALGLLARYQGEPELAWAQVRAFHPMGSDHEPGDTNLAHAIMAQALASNLALDANDPTVAAQWIAAHGRWLHWCDAVLWRAEHQLLRARHAILSGDMVGARASAEAALAHATAPRQPLALLAVHRQFGELETAEAQFIAAQAHLDAALALADACAAPYDRALCLLALAELRWATKRVTEVKLPLSEARATFARLGADPALARADRLAAKLALVRPQPAHPDDLTERELAVLRLAAAGRSNREAAAALSVSERTVERHLENTYRKIDARNRADAVAYAVRHNLT